jgi:integrase
MSLVKKGKHWFIVYCQKNKQIWKTTGQEDKEIAEAIHTQFMAILKENKTRAIVAKLLGQATPEPARNVLQETKRRLKINRILDVCQRYKELSVNHTRAFNRFISSLSNNITYADEITGDMAFDYLHANYGELSGKAWNNNKTYLHSIFKTILLDAGLSESPFARVIQKRDNGKHQRPFTDAECKMIINAAKEPWKSAAIIAYHTGLRQKDIFELRWNNINGNIITVTPAKTSRHGKAVQIPIHSELSKYLSTLPRKNQRVLGFSDTKCHNSGSFTTAFGKILEELNIEDTEHGIVNFNSFRNTFITRCRAAGIAEHAIRGIAGHGTKELTDLYSHDITSAMAILQLPSNI